MCSVLKVFYIQYRCSGDSEFNLMFDSEICITWFKRKKSKSADPRADHKKAHYGISKQIQKWKGEEQGEMIDRFEMLFNLHIKSWGRAKS